MMADRFVYSINIWAATWQNQQNGWASSEDSDQPGHRLSLISLRYPHEEIVTLGPQLPIEHTAKTLIRKGGCPGCSESSLGAHSFIGSVMSWLSSLLCTEPTNTTTPDETTQEQQIRGEIPENSDVTVVAGKQCFQLFKVDRWFCFRNGVFVLRLLLPLLLLLLLLLMLLQIK